jgi:hypothetical protein
MSEERKKEDFVDLLKRMKTDMDKPSVIGDALDKLEKLQKENAELKEKLEKSMNFIRSSEQVLQKSFDERERIKDENSVVIERLGVDIVDLKNQNSALTNKIKELENLLLGKNNELQQKQRELAQLRTKEEAASRELEVGSQSKPQSNEHIQKLEGKINYLEQKIEQLVEENANLAQKLVDQKNKLTIDYVVPIVEATTTAKKPEPTPNSSPVSTLETLCQDLQSDLNRYKRYIDSLKAENKDLKKALETGEGSVDFEQLNALKNENISHKVKILELEKTLEEQTLDDTLLLESENTIKELQNQLIDKEILINELKSSQITQPVTPSSPMTSLVDDLQARINKLKIALSEKDKIIEELKRK